MPGAKSVRLLTKHIRRETVSGAFVVFVFLMEVPDHEASAKWTILTIFLQTQYQYHPCSRFPFLHLYLECLWRWQSFVKHDQRPNKKGRQYQRRVDRRANDAGPAYIGITL